MTQAERLIRNLCETRRLELVEAEKAAKNAIEDTVPWKALPKKIQAAVIELHQVREREAVLVKVITKAHFYEHSVRRGKALRCSDTSERRTNMGRLYTAKYAKVQDLKAQATIDTMGQPPAFVRGRLLRLSNDLAEI